jgi:hypothetical protein
LEFLRQQTESFDEALTLAVTTADITNSAHAEESCARCHTGFDRWPHAGATSTATCASCHEDAAALWTEGAHAHVDEAGAEAASCASCHGVHDVRPAPDLLEGPGMNALNAGCVACHETDGLPPDDPHAETVSCASCHAAHDVHPVEDLRARVAPLAQPETCGACHEEAATAYGGDAHLSALAASTPTGLSTLALQGPEGPPTCSSCHGGHGMLAVDDPVAQTAAVERCSTCHQDYADTYFGTYHGKATALGSHVVATCDDCHSSHEIEPATDSASWVHADNLIATCSTCHEHARPAFVAYDSHPNPMDRGRNAPLFYSFVFMNTLLIGVLVVFGLHTLLWWVRILLDQRAAARSGGHDG